MSRFAADLKTDYSVGTEDNSKAHEGKKTICDLSDGFTNSQKTKSGTDLKSPDFSFENIIENHETKTSFPNIFGLIKNSKKKEDFQEISDKPHKRKKRKIHKVLDEESVHKRRRENDVGCGVADFNFNQMDEARLKSSKNVDCRRKKDEHISEELECSPCKDVTTIDSQVLPSGLSDMPGHEEEDFTVQTQTAIKSEEDSFDDITEAADLIPYIQRKLSNGSKASKPKYQLPYKKDDKSIDLCVDKLLENIDKREKEKENVTSVELYDSQHQNTGCSNMLRYDMSLELQPDILLNSHDCLGNEVLEHGENVSSKKKKKTKGRYNIIKESCDLEMCNIPSNNQLVYEALSNVPDNMENKHMKGEHSNSYQRRGKKQKSKFLEGLDDKNVNSAETELLDTKKTKKKKQKMLDELVNKLLLDSEPAEINDSDHVTKKKKKKKSKVSDQRAEANFEPQDPIHSQRKDPICGVGLHMSKNIKKPKKKNLGISEELMERDLCQKGVNMKPLTENILDAFDPVHQKHTKSKECASVHKKKKVKTKKKSKVIRELDEQDLRFEGFSSKTSEFRDLRDIDINNEETAFKKKQKEKKMKNVEIHKELFKEDFYLTVNDNLAPLLENKFLSSNDANQELVDNEQVGIVKKKKPKKNKKFGKADVKVDECDNGAALEWKSPIDSLEKEVGAARESITSRTEKKINKLDHQTVSDLPICSFGYTSDKQFNQEETNFRKKKKKKKKKHEICEESVTENLCQSVAVDLVPLQEKKIGLFDDAHQGYIDMIDDEMLGVVKTKNHKKKKKSKFADVNGTEDVCPSGTGLVLLEPTDSSMKEIFSNNIPKKDKRKKRKNLEHGSAKKPLCPNGIRFQPLPENVLSSFDHADQIFLQSKKEKPSKRSKFVEGMDSAEVYCEAMSCPVDSYKSELTYTKETEKCKRKKDKKKKLKDLDESLSENVYHSNTSPELFPQDKLISLVDCQNQEIIQDEIANSSKKKRKKRKKNLLDEGTEEILCHSDADLKQLAASNMNSFDCSDLTERERIDIVERKKEKRTKKSKAVEEKRDEDIFNSKPLFCSMSSDHVKNLHTVIEIEGTNSIKRRKQKKKKKSEFFQHPVNECNGVEDIDLVKRKKEKKKKKKISFEKTDSDINLNIIPDGVLGLIDGSRNDTVECQGTDFVKRKKDKKRSELIDQGTNVCLSHPRINSHIAHSLGCPNETHLESTNNLKKEKRKQNNNKLKFDEESITVDAYLTSTNFESFPGWCLVPFDQMNKEPIENERVDAVTKRKENREVISNLSEKSLNMPGLSVPYCLCSESTHSNTSPCGKLSSCIENKSPKEKKYIKSPDKSMTEDFLDSNRSKLFSPPYSAETKEAPNDNFITQQQSFKNDNDESERKTADLLDEHFDKNDCEKQSLITALSPIRCEPEKCINKPKNEPNDILHTKIELENEEHIEVELTSLHGDLVSHETSQVDCRSVNQASKAETTSNLDGTYLMDFRPLEPISVGMPSTSNVKHTSDVESMKRIENDMTLCQKSNVDLSIKEIDSSQWHRLTCDSNGAFTQTPQHGSEVFLQGMEGDIGDLELEKPEDSRTTLSSHAKSQDSSENTSENEVILPGRGQLRGLTQALPPPKCDSLESVPVPEGESRVVGSSENNGREDKFNKEFVKRLAEKLTLKLSTSPSNCIYSDNSDSSDDEEIQLTGRGKLRGLTQKLPSSALKVETKTKKNVSDQKTQRTAAPSSENGKSVMGTSLLGSQSGESSSSSLDERDKADFVNKKPKVFKRRADTKHKCTRCYTSFPTATEMMRHDCRLVRKKIQPPKRKGAPGRYQCEICDRKYTQKAHLTHHVKSVHLGYRPYKCDVCEMNFATKQTLVVHMRIHTGSRPFKCRYCGANWITTSHLHRHYRKYHFMVAKEHCEFCDLSYFHEDELEDHLKTKHKKKLCHTVKKLVDTSDDD